MKEYRLGIDIGSTTLKAVVIDSDTAQCGHKPQPKYNDNGD